MLIVNQSKKKRLRKKTADLITAHSNEHQFFFKKEASAMVTEPTGNRYANQVEMSRKRYGN